MKKKLNIVFVVVFALVISTSVIFATDVEEIEEGSISLQSTYYTAASATISITNSGVAKCSGKITGRLGTTTRTYIRLCIQQYKNGDWNNLSTWSSIGDTVNRTITTEKNVAKGYKYRVKAICKSYSGSKSESITKYSKAISY